MPYSSRRILLMVIGSIAIIAAVALVWQGYSRRQPPSQDRLDLAVAGVDSNMSWEPTQRRVSGLDLMLVPAGCFDRGSSDLQLEEANGSCQRFFGAGGCTYDFARGEQPTHEVCFKEPFWIGRTEGTNAQYGAPLYTEREAHYRGPSWPVENISFAEAQEFCADRGLRLPTEAEWEYAARGPDAWIYPWGDVFEPEYLIWGQLNPGPVASHPAGASWVGAEDMSGGVAEWVTDPFLDYGNPAPGGQASISTDELVARGGSWFSFAPFFVRSAFREVFAADYTSSVIGFRCASDLSGLAE